MKILFLVGVEGSGHHMVLDLLNGHGIALLDRSVRRESLGLSWGSADLSARFKFTDLLMHYIKARNLRSALYVLYCTLNKRDKYIPVNVNSPSFLRSVKNVSSSSISTSDGNLELPFDKQLHTIRENIKNSMLSMSKKESRKDGPSANATFLRATSFPFGDLRGKALRRPDIIEFEEIVSDIQDFVEVKYLVLYRNPISAAYSSFRRFSNNLLFAAKMTEDNLIYIERQFTQIPPSRYKTLIYEDFLKDPDRYVDPLAEWWGLDKDLLRANSNTKLRQPTQLSDIPSEWKSTLEEFFSEKRINQWKDFYHSNGLL